MTATACPACGGSGEVPVNPEAAWSGHVQALTFRACGDCAERCVSGEPMCPGCVADGACLLREGAS